MPRRQSSRRTRRISWAPSGWLISSTTPALCTDLVTLTCPDDFLAVRAGFTNIMPEPYIVTRVIATASSSAGDYVNPTGVPPFSASSWRPLTFANNGRAADNIVTDADAPTTIIVRGSPVRSGGAPLPCWTWTDWVPLRSLPRTDQPGGPRVLMIRVLMPQGCAHTNPNGGFTEFRGDPDINRGSSYVAGQVPLDAVTVPEVIDAEVANVGIANPAVSCVQFLTRHEGIVGMAAGDSHHQGSSTTTEFWNYLMRSALDLGARYVGRIPFGYWSTAQGGAGSEWFFSNLTNVLDVAQPSFVVLPGWTYNDQPSDETAFLGRLLMTADACEKAGAVPIFLTPFPRDPASMTPPVLESWRNLRQAILALQADGAVVLDATSFLSHQMDGTYLPAYTGDGVHPNNAGHAAIAAALTPVIERVCGLTA